MVLGVGVGVGGTLVVEGFGGGVEEGGGGGG